MMTITCWILLIGFTLLGLPQLVKYFTKGVSKEEGEMLMLSLFVTAICAGILFG